MSQTANGGSEFPQDENLPVSSQIPIPGEHFLHASAMRGGWVRSARFVSEVAFRKSPGRDFVVEEGSGDLYRIPKEVLLEGSSTLVRKESAGSSTFLQVSKNPFITTFEARMICAEHNVSPNF